MAHGFPARRTAALSIHAHFTCGRSGACCQAGWSIPIDEVRGAHIERALASGRIETPGHRGAASRTRSPLDRHPGTGLSRIGPPAVLARTPDGACAFFDRASRGCAIQRALGHAALPIACQHFPRVCLIDDRGVSATLSHYCPTAAATLFDAPGPLGIVTGPPMLDRGVEWEGLDARGEWPPLLRPGCLMDLESYDAWERLGVAVFARDDLSAEAALALVAEATERIRSWRPSERAEPLVERVAATAAWCASAPPPERAGRAGGRDAAGVVTAETGRVEDWRARAAAYDLVRRSAEPGLVIPPLPEAASAADHRWVEPAWSAFSGPVRRYLAARLFASWLAYQGRGLRTVVAGVRLALDVVRVEAAGACLGAAHDLDRALLLEAVRAADRLLLHDASREALAGRLDTIAPA